MQSVNPPILRSLALYPWEMGKLMNSVQSAHLGRNSSTPGKWVNRCNRCTPPTKVAVPLPPESREIGAFGALRLSQSLSHSHRDVVKWCTRYIRPISGLFLYSREMVKLVQFAPQTGFFNPVLSLFTGIS